MWQRAERTRDLAMSSNGFRCHARLLDKRNAPTEQHRPAGNQPANISLTRVANDTLTAPPVTAQGSNSPLRDEPQQDSWSRIPAYPLTRVAYLSASSGVSEIWWLERVR